MRGASPPNFPVRRGREVGSGGRLPALSADERPRGRYPLTGNSVRFACDELSVGACLYRFFMKKMERIRIFFQTAIAKRKKKLYNKNEQKRLRQEAGNGFLSEDVP